MYRAIQKETRLSERQVSQLRWSQIDQDTITTKYKRQVKMSRELAEALSVMPKGKGSDLVFFGSSSLLHMGETDEMAAIRLSLQESQKPQKKWAIFKAHL